LVPPVISSLGLSADESYHVELTGLSRQTSTEWPQSGIVSYSGGCNAEPPPPADRPRE
jgi:phage terminase Nu1 subunit (DNA packaging protein)